MGSVLLLLLRRVWRQIAVVGVSSAWRLLEQWVPVALVDGIGGALRMRVDSAMLYDRLQGIPVLLTELGS